jgi:hypothetical protein
MSPYAYQLSKDKLRGEKAALAACRGRGNPDLHKHIDALLSVYDNVSKTRQSHHSWLRRVAVCTAEAVGVAVCTAKACMDCTTPCQWLSSSHAQQSIMTAIA